MAAKNSKSPKEHGVDGTQASFEKHKSGKSVKQKPRPGKGKKKAASARGTGGAETKKKQTRLEKYQKNLALYRDMDYLEGEAETHLLMTREYLRSGNLPRAEFHATKSIEIYEKLESMEELAEAFELMGDVKEALDQESAVDDFRSARKIFEELEEKPRIRRLLVKSANVYLKHGNHKEALHRFSQAQGMEHTQDLVLSMGLCNEKLGELDKALDIYRGSLEGGGGELRATAYIRIGDLYLHQKKRESLAEDAYLQAEKVHGFHNQARAQARLGAFYRSRKEHEKARIYLKKALENAERGGKKSLVKKLQMELCELYHLLDMEGEALIIYKQMLKTSVDSEKAGILAKMAGIYRKEHRDEDLLRTLKKLAELNRSIGQLADLLENYQQLEELYQRTGASTKLLENYKQIAQAAREVEDRSLEAEYNNKIERFYIEKGNVNKHKEFLTEMKEYYFSLGDPEAAIAFFHLSWSLHQEKGLRELQAEDAVKLGKFFMSAADYGRADDWFLKADPLFVQLGDRLSQGLVQVSRGSLEKCRGNYDAAIACYLKARKHFKAAGDQHWTIRMNSYIETIYDLKARAIHSQRAEIIDQINRRKTKIGTLETKNAALRDRMKDLGRLLEEIGAGIGEMDTTIMKMKGDMARTSSEKKKTKIQVQLKALKKNLQKGKETKLRLRKELRDSQDEIRSNEGSIQTFRNELRVLEKESVRLRQLIRREEDKALEQHRKGQEQNPLISSLTKLEEVESEIYTHLAQGKVPAMVFPTRTKTNIEFDDRTQVYKLGSLTTNRTAKSVAGANMLLRTSYVIDFIRTMIDSSFKGKPRSSTLREMYYISESWGKLGKFDSQDGSNQVIEDLEVMTKWMREHFKLRPEEDGARVIGDITIREKNRKGKWKKINCKDDVGDSGYTIPYNVEKDKLEFPKVNSNFIMAIETGGMFDRLVENGFDEAFNCTLIHIKGQPARSTRRFMKRLSEEVQIPVYCFTDGDPWSYRIFASIAYGAIKTAHISDYLATPIAQYIGITPSDIITYELPSDKLSAQDVSALKAELTDPRFSNPFWQSEIKQQLKMGRKSEQQALAKYGLDFVTDTYLPEKLQELEGDMMY